MEEMGEWGERVGEWGNSGEEGKRKDRQTEGRLNEGRKSKFLILTFQSYIFIGRSRFINL